MKLAVSPVSFSRALAPGAACFLILGAGACSAPPAEENAALGTSSASGPNPSSPSPIVAPQTGSMPQVGVGPVPSSVGPVTPEPSNPNGPGVAPPPASSGPVSVGPLPSQVNNGGSSGMTVVVPSGGTGNDPSLGGSGGTGALPGNGGETTGGTAGTTQGGSGGEVPSGGSGGSPIPSDGEVLFSEDFESAAVGEVPAGWDTFVAWTANGQNPQGNTFALVETGQVHGGAQAMHFSGGTNPAMITRPLPPGTNRLWVTAWVWMSRQLGQNPGANHETLIGIRGEPGSANNEVRFGEIKGVIGTNEVPTDDISPLMDQWGMGPVVPANAWACFEIEFAADQAQHELHAWVDGTLVHSVTSPDQWQNKTLSDPNWMDGKFQEVILGWHSFSGADIDVWMDDVIVSTGRQGCP